MNPNEKEHFFYIQCYLVKSKRTPKQIFLLVKKELGLNEMDSYYIQRHYEPSGRSVATRTIGILFFVSRKTIQWVLEAQKTLTEKEYFNHVSIWPTTSIDLFELYHEDK